MKGFAFRALASSLAGHILDTILFCTIAFAFLMPLSDLGRMIALGIAMKWGYEWAVIPITYKATKWVRRKEGLE
jgi:uncharacterized PurR-regulated membrane protein YhhQ (DUF165 family)